jgi:hypothetical protein
MLGTKESGRGLRGRLGTLLPRRGLRLLLSVQRISQKLEIGLILGPAR